MRSAPTRRVRPARMPIDRRRTTPSAQARRSAHARPGRRRIARAVSVALQRLPPIGHVTLRRNQLAALAGAIERVGAPRHARRCGTRRRSFASTRNGRARPRMGIGRRVRLSPPQIVARNDRADDEPASARLRGRRARVQALGARDRAGDQRERRALARRVQEPPARRTRPRGRGGRSRLAVARLWRIVRRPGARIADARVAIAGAARSARERVEDDARRSARRAVGRRLAGHAHALRAVRRADRRAADRSRVIPGSSTGGSKCRTKAASSSGCSSRRGAPTWSSTSARAPAARRCCSVR